MADHPMMPTDYLWRLLPENVRKAYASLPGGLAQSLQAAYSIPGKVSDFLSSPEPQPGYDATTAPPDMRENYRAIEPDPNLEYASRWLPVAKDKTTGKPVFTMNTPGWRDLGGALLDAQAGVQTGELTKRAIGGITAASSMGGGLLAREGSLAMGGAPRRRGAPFRVPEVARPDLDVPPAGIGHNNPPVTLPPYLNPDGSAIQGSAFSKASQKSLAEVNAMQPGAGPLDLSGNQRIPGILQEPIPRYDVNAPRRHGVPQRMQDALGSVAVQDAALAAIDKGIGMNAHKWYHNRALYDAFTNELGPEEGHAQFQKYMDMQSAASPRSDVPTNIRNASYYFVNPRGYPQFKDTENEYPYGHLGQKLHRGNADKMMADQGDWGGYDPLENPKPPSYGTNLGGNLVPVAADTHAYRLIAMNSKDPRFLGTPFDELTKIDPRIANIDKSKMTPEEIEELGKVQKWGDLVMDKDDPTKPMMKDGKFKIRYNPQKLHAEGRLTMEEALKQPTMWQSDPNENEYKAVEDFYAELGQRRGLTPAEAQSAAWAGGGNTSDTLPVGTGLGTPSNRTFGQMHNERVLYTAKMRNEDPKETLRKLIRKEAPLLSLPGGGVPTGLLSDAQEPQQMSQEELRRGRALLDEQRVY